MNVTFSQLAEFFAYPRIDKPKLSGAQLEVLLGLHMDEMTSDKLKRNYSNIIRNAYLLRNIL